MLDEELDQNIIYDELNDKLPILLTNVVRKSPFCRLHNFHKIVCNVKPVVHLINK